MKVLNVHSRVIDKPAKEVATIFDHLATENDLVWPHRKWPPMRFREGVKVGAKGGHGPVRYTIEKFVPGKMIEFRFSRPRGFHGVHRLELTALNSDTSELVHAIDMEIRGLGIITWHLIIRPLHDALLEDALDQAENHFVGSNKTTPWDLWVRILRFVLK
ncbi:MAG: hypothetical protein OEM26_14255 [Saprospiraceae bacterium]|nr:hypothetical protein [Saprospiraceae bacterium]